jgi:hypothetical protein
MDPDLILLLIGGHECTFFDKLLNKIIGYICFKSLPNDSFLNCMKDGCTAYKTLLHKYINEISQNHEDIYSQFVNYLND